MFKDNLIQLRKNKKLTQESIAESLGVSRQAVAKWESGETVPDLDKCKALANLFEVTIDDLANYEPKENLGLEIPPRGKHFFGLTQINEKGQIEIPSKALEIFNIKAGDSLVVLGDENYGLAISKKESFMVLTDMVKNAEKS